MDSFKLTIPRFSFNSRDSGRSSNSNNNNPDGAHNDVTASGTTASTGSGSSMFNLLPNMSRFNFNNNRDVMIEDLSHMNMDSPMDVSSSEHHAANPATAPSPSVPTRLNNLAQATFARLMNGTRQHKRASLPIGYTPGNLDVCCGRGKRNWNHAGNVYFRNVIRNNVDRYIAAPSKNDKTLVVISIVDEIRGQGGRFLKEDSCGRWYDIGDAQARDKVGHSLRDQVTAQSRQKNKKEVVSAATTTLTQQTSQATMMSQTSAQSSESYENNNPYGYEEQYRKPRRMSVIPPEQELVVERRASIQSDSGVPEFATDHDLRRSARGNSVSTQVFNSFTRRPSFLAFSFNSREGQNHRASTLLGGDQQAAMILDQVRRSTNWEWLESLDDLLELENENFDTSSVNLDYSDMAAALEPKPLGPHEGRDAIPATLSYNEGAYSARATTMMRESIQSFDPMRGSILQRDMSLNSNIHNTFEPTASMTSTTVANNNEQPYGGSQQHAQV
jgi:hypothetical protein